MIGVLVVTLLANHARSVSGAADADSLADANALIKFKSTIWFDPLHILNTWTPPGGIGSHACAYTGITCDSSGTFRVIEVALGSKRLREIMQQSLRNLTKTVRFNLSDNEFMGDLPNGLGDMTGLQYFDVSHNFFTGYVPLDFGNLQVLQHFDVGSNQLTGNLVELTSPVLTYVDFSNNTIEGSIPSGYAYLPLQVLLLGNNGLTGSIPGALGSGPSSGITQFNVSTNFLTGKIPKGLGNAPLTVFALEGNMLSGEIPPTGVMKQFYPDGFFPGNLGLCGAIMGVACPKPPIWWKAVVGVFTPMFLIGLAVYIYKVVPPGEYTARSIIHITDDFSNSNLIGVGGLSTIYKAVLGNGKVVAVKRVRPEYYRQKRKLFQIERRRLMDVRHPNIVKVLGSCCTGSLKVLVLEHMPNGNLSMHLHGASETGTVLPWNARLDIAGGVAQGLAYLHGEYKGSRAMHCDVKASAVLFDERFTPKLTDVRLANVHSPDGGLTDVGYMAPEYLLTRTCTSAAEVYSFGTLVLELLTGKRPGATQGSLPGMVKEAFPYNVQSVVDPNLQQLIVDGGPVLEQMTTCARIGLLCTNELANERPSMQDVLTIFGQAYSPPRATVPLPGWVMLALGVAQEDHTERTPWTKVPLPLWLMLLLGLAQDNSNERIPTSLLME